MKKLIILPFLLLFVWSSAQITWTTDSIPMRDGKKLLADYYLPSNCTSCPVILIQTPYNKNAFHSYLPLGVGFDLPNSNYAFVVVDWRGFNASAQALNGTPNRGEDGYDCIDWIAQQSWCDGNIGTWGPSALGKIQFETAKEQHPNHKCAVPLVADPVFKYEDYFPGGVYRKEYVDQLDALGYGLSPTLLANPVYNLTWAVAQNQSTYPSQINIPFFMIGGWFDHNVDGMLNFFNLLKTQSPVAVRDKHKLLMGPWAHGGNGSAYVGSLQQGDWQFPNAAGINDSLAILFFDYYLRGQTANAWNNYYMDKLEIGTGYEGFYPDYIGIGFSYNTNPLYLNDNGLLLDNLTSPGDTTLVYDPRDPSPTIGGPTLLLSLDQGPYDQSQLVENRNDIASFDLFYGMYAPFYYGKPEVHLFVSSDRKDTDFAVRLTDVDENTGESIIIADGIRRLRFRDGFAATDTAVGVPGQVYEVVIDLPFICHDIKYDHHLRLDITSSNYPRFDRNLNNGGTQYTAGDTLIATNTIYYNSSYSSYITLPNYTPWSIEELEQVALINTIPNPSTSQIKLILPNSQNWNIQLMDVTGKIISEENYFGNNFEKNISYLENGVYFVKIKSETKQLYHSRFIKQ